MQAAPALIRCEFRNRGFTAMGKPLFRRAATDGAPVMVVRLGDRDAVFPLGSLQRSLDIEPGSDDGRMLGFVADSLDFVGSLSLGDTLPTEVVSGHASWSPDPWHTRVAMARLQLRLIYRVDDRAISPDDAAGLPAIANRPENQVRVRHAAAVAAHALGLPHAVGVDLLLDDLARELGYVEALRARLLIPARALVERLAGMIRGEGVAHDTLTQVQRLSAQGLTQITDRFADLEPLTEDIVVALGELDVRRETIRAGRDWLYRHLRAWTPIFSAWDDPAQTTPEKMPARLADLYRFLAPRFMPTRDWLQGRSTVSLSAPTTTRMFW